MSKIYGHITFQMIEEYPTEERIATAIAAYSGDIYEESDAIRFLNITEYDKPNTVRLICWLVQMRLVQADRMKWIPNIYQLVTYYKRCVERYIGDCYERPLDAITGPTAGLIHDSVHDALPWFTRFAQAIGVDKIFIEDAELRVQRMFTVLKFDLNGFKYELGYQNFAFICYLIATSYCKKGGLPLTFAEAIASHMTRSLISIVAFTEKLDNLKVNDDHYRELEILMKRFAPDALKKLTHGGINLVDFVQRWEKNLYSNEHSPYNLLIIWDDILCNINQYRKYIRFLHVAHFRQMLQSDINFDSDESIINMKWDGVELLEDAEYISRESLKSPYDMIYRILCPCIDFRKNTRRVHLF